MKKVILALGSNIYNRFSYLFKAKEELEKISNILSSSAYLETKAIGPIQNDFINQSLLVETLLSPEELLYEIKKIEKKLGRKKRYHWGPREIDIDILFYESVNINTESLTIPHKEIYNRDFILASLNSLNKISLIDIFKFFSIKKINKISNKGFTLLS